MANRFYVICSFNGKNIDSCFKQRICLLSGMLNNNNSTTAEWLRIGNENHCWVVELLEGHSRQNVIK